MRQIRLSWSDIFNLLLSQIRLRIIQWFLSSLSLILKDKDSHFGYFWRILEDTEKVFLK